MRVTLCVLLAAVCAAGCGSGKSTLHEQETQITFLSRENQRLQDHLRTVTLRAEALEHERTTLQRDLAAARDTLAALEHRIAELETALAAAPTAAAPDVLHVETLPVDDYYEPAGARLTPTGVRRLAPLIQDLKRRYPGGRFRVEGYAATGTLPAALKERFPSSWELSAARAAMLVRHLQWTHRIDPTRLEVVGYGHYRPKVPNTTAEGRRQNRVVRIVVLAE